MKNEVKSKLCSTLSATIVVTDIGMDLCADYATSDPQILSTNANIVKMNNTHAKNVKMTNLLFIT